MNLTQGDRGFILCRSNLTEKIAVTVLHSAKEAPSLFSFCSDNSDISIAPRALPIAAIPLSQRQKDNYFPLALAIDPDPTWLTYHSFFTFEGPGPVSTRRCHEPGEPILFACHFNEYIFAFQEATIVTYDRKNREYLVRKRSFSGEDTFIVPRYCVYIPNWRLLHTRCRDAILTWRLCAKRIGVAKDIAKIIAREIWDLRDECEWGGG